MEQTTEKNTPKEYLEPNPSFEEIEEQIRTAEMVYQAMDQAEESIIRINYDGKLVHKWFKADDEKQKMVAYAYKLWWIDFVKLIECENWNWNINAVWDNGHAFWLCQMNDLYHKLPAEYKTNRVVQVEYCYKKWKSWTKFYWPSRIVKGQTCANYVKDRFTLEK